MVGCFDFFCSCFNNQDDHSQRKNRTINEDSVSHVPDQQPPGYVTPHKIPSDSPLSDPRSVDSNSPIKIGQTMTHPSYGATSLLSPHHAKSSNRYSLLDTPPQSGPTTPQTPHYPVHTINK
ncbi:MAG: hypothetical protein ACOVQX_05420 [Legionella sp.]